jgi:hypothetical protein
MSIAVATSVKTGKKIRLSKRRWNEQLAAYFGKVDLGIDIKANRSR